MLGSPFTPDESTYGLAMVHILNRKPWPVFFYAQPYTGTQSAIIAACLARLIGFWPYFLKLVPLLASVGLIWANYYLANLIYRLLPSSRARRTRQVERSDRLLDSLHSLGMTKGEVVGLIAALLTALLPSFAQNWGVRAGSGYPEVALVGSLCLIIGIKLLFENKSYRSSPSQAQGKLESRTGRRLSFSTQSLRSFARRVTGLKLQKCEIHFFLLGLLAGFGYWIQPAIAFYLIPLAWLLLLKYPDFWKRRWFYLANLGLIIGSAPVIWFNLQNDLYTGRALLNKPGGMKNALVIFFTEGLPPLLGTRASWSRADYFLPLAVVVWLTYAAAFLNAGVSLLERGFVETTDFFKKVTSFRMGRVSLIRLIQNAFYALQKTFLSDPRTILILIILIAPPIFAISPFNWFIIEPRYIYPLYSVLPVLLALFLVGGFNHANASPARSLPRLFKYLTSQSMCILLLILVLASNVLSMVSPQKNSRPTSFEAVTDLTPVIEFMRQENIKYVYSSFMFCHRLTFESKEDIICTPFEGGFGEWRYPQYKDIVAKAPKEEKGFLFLVRKDSERETADNYTVPQMECKDDLSKQNDPCFEKIIGPFRISWFR